MHTDSNLRKRYKAMYCKNSVLVQGEVWKITLKYALEPGLDAPADWFISSLGS